MEYLSRTPNSKRFSNLVGKTNENGIEILTLLGPGVMKDGRISKIFVYEARCSLCKQTFRMWSNAWRKQRHCGCGPIRLKQYDDNTRRYWLDNIRNRTKWFVERWQKYDSFAEDVYKLPKNNIILPIDFSKPIGPGNMVLCYCENGLRRCHLRRDGSHSKLWVLTGPNLKQDCKVYNCSDIGKVLNLTKQRIQQMEYTAIENRLKSIRVALYTISEWLEVHPDTPLVMVD